jgi:hypothetical protein
MNFRRSFLVPVSSCACSGVSIAEKPLKLLL